MTLDQEWTIKDDGFSVSINLNILQDHHNKRESWSAEFTIRAFNEESFNHICCIDSKELSFIYPEDHMAVSSSFSPIESTMLTGYPLREGLYTGGLKIHVDIFDPGVYHCCFPITLDKMATFNIFCTITADHNDFPELDFSPVNMSSVDYFCFTNYMRNQNHYI